MSCTQGSCPFSEPFNPEKLCVSLEVPDVVGLLEVLQNTPDTWENGKFEFTRSSCYHVVTPGSRVERLDDKAIIAQSVYVLHAVTPCAS